MTFLLDQLLLPQRLAIRALDDLHRIANAAAALGALAQDARAPTTRLPDWMDDTAATLRALRDQAVGIHTTMETMGRDVRILRDEFGRANDEIARLREAFGPELEGLRQTAQGLHQELGSLRELLAALEQDVDQFGNGVTTEMRTMGQAVRDLARDADEISDVVEPLQAATERVGRVANRLPGGNRS